MLSRFFRVACVKMRHEVPERLSFSRELKLYLMKRPRLCDADLEQHQVADDFYTERRISTLWALEAHRRDAETRFQIPPKLFNAMVLRSSPECFRSA